MCLYKSSGRINSGYWCRGSQVRLNISGSSSPWRDIIFRSRLNSLPQNIYYERFLGPVLFLYLLTVLRRTVLPPQPNHAGGFAFRFHSPLPFDSACPLACLFSSHPQIAPAINIIVWTDHSPGDFWAPSTRDDMTWHLSRHLYDIYQLNSSAHTSRMTTPDPRWWA